MRAAVLAGLLAAACSAAQTQGETVPLQDSAQGMTCRFHVAGARMAWTVPGGDWLDSSDQRQGLRAFSQTLVSPSRVAERVSWPVDTLIRAWGEGRGVQGAIHLRALASGSVIDFASREHPMTIDQPLLRVVWDDGQTDRYTPSADTHLDCSTHGSEGGNTLLKVSGDRGAVLVFPFKPRAGRKVESASLQLTSLLARNRGSMVGTFLAALPEGSPVTSGLAAGKRGIDDLKGRPEVILVEDFDGRTWRTVPARSESGPDVSTVTTDAAESFAPLQGAALRVRLLKGQTQGLNVHLRLAVNGGGEPEEAYFRYYLRLGSSWDPDLDGGKMPGFAGTYGRAGWGNRKSDGRNGWSTRGAFFKYTDDGSPLSKLRGLGSYVYHAEMSGIDGESWGWNLSPTGLLQKGRWYCIEQHVRLNRPGSGDGVLRAWVDGRLVFERRDLRYREVPDLKIESVWLNVYHGGTQASPRDMTLFIDDLVVAREYIGPSLPAR